MKNLWKLMTWLVVLGLMTVGIYSPALAAETANPNGKCSITLNIDSKKEAEGGSYAAYQVTTLKEENGKYVFKDIYGDKTYDFNTTVTENLLKSFLENISGDGVKPTATTSAQKGQLKFENLDPGYYLIMETKSISGYNPMSPCLVVVPQYDAGKKQYNFDLVSDTKAKITATPEEESTLPPDDDDDVIDDDDDDITDSEDDYSSDSDDDSSSSTNKLPQTGQLWWPLPLLLCAGLILMLVGRKIRR